MKPTEAWSKNSEIFSRYMIPIGRVVEWQETHRIVVTTTGVNGGKIRTKRANRDFACVGRVFHVGFNFVDVWVDTGWAVNSIKRVYFHQFKA